MDDRPRPGAAGLVALGTDDWAALLAVALPVVRQLPEPLVDATVRRLAALPPGRLVGGRSRRDLAAVLARDEVWSRVEDALPADAPRPWDEPAEGDAGPDTAAQGPATTAEAQRLAHLEAREQTLTARLAGLRDELATLRRERDGAVARAARAEEEAEQAVVARDRALAEVEAARERLAGADDRVEREVARRTRRDDADRAALVDELAAARREVDELRRALAREQERVEELVAARAASSAGAAATAPTDEGSGRRGRPSVLPDGVEPGTREAAAWLVGEGRVLLVDGYNVTRTHRASLSLAEQRRWLEDAVTALARRRQVRATIVWDAGGGAASTRRRRGGVEVRFTPDGVTADDELVLHVRLAVDPEQPVVVVTDDVELRGRLAEHGVDLLDSTSFTWLL